MQNFPKIEENILKYWQDNKIFEKTLKKESPKGDYVFYDGPPFATGLPHYGHILSSVAKDMIPRYFTMKGYRVPRRWGWDCHGLPIENLIEKKLEISGKKDIEKKIGVEKFNKECQNEVLMYTGEWKKMVERIGRWIEFDNAYKTMDTAYMESVWWALKTIWDKGLIYEGRKVLMYCPRCETPISKAEVAMDNSYRDITEESVTVKFRIKNKEPRIKKWGLPKNARVYILSWTTTAWTLPANVALAVGENMDYSLIKQGGEYFILAKELARNYFSENFEEVKVLKGKDLINIEYEPLVDIPALKETGKKAWYVTDGDFVTIEDGTGVVHTAVVYGEDDYNLGIEKDLPVVPLLDEKGNFNDKSPEFICGQYFKKAEKDIKKYLQDNNLVFRLENYTHSYPHCWRCDTQLFYNAISAWFINIQKVKKRMIELNKKINWYPGHLKEGRFLNILKTAPDWNISRNRYWATPLPFWRCQNGKKQETRNKKQKEGCGNVECIGSIEELKKKAINFSDVYKSKNLEKIDLHKHNADKIKLKCEKCNGQMTRIPEVIDCWVESASMPFAEHHYPFENREVFKKRFPGEYIAEYIAQTRAWFYYMHALSTILFDEISFKNCVTTGTILNYKGDKLSKSKKNYTDPWNIIDEYGMDSLRYYLMTSAVMRAENLFFNDRGVREVYNKIIVLLLNVLTFYKTFSAGEQVEDLEEKDLEHVLDIWIISKLNLLIKEVTSEMDKYNTVKAGRPFKEFINDLSTWYLRRSRNRFKGEDKDDKLRALKTLRHILFNLAKLMAPLTPYIAEYIYQELKGRLESVHLESWPDPKVKVVDDKGLNNMDITRKVIELGLAKRAEAKIKVRQPLNELTVNNQQLTREYQELIKDELNIKKIKLEKDKSEELTVELDLNISEELKKEGMLREIVRTINQMRKKQKMTVKDRIIVEYNSNDEMMNNVFEKYKEDIRKHVLADKIEKTDKDLKKVEVNDIGLGLEIEKL
ncbi:MAG: isoleucine--tRNA ligase [Patescibacteria group bacterium]